MRRLGVIVAVLVLVTGCDTSGADRSGRRPDEKVTHVVFYDMQLLGGSGFRMLLTYTGPDGENARVESTSPTWSREVRVAYPDVTTVLLSGNATPNPAARAPLGTRLPDVRCVLWVDGEVVDDETSLQPTCEATLSASARPIPSGSRSR